jgi:hypothetical protein
VRFSALLARLERELDVPYPARRELVAEIAADLDAAFEAALQDGLDPVDAEAAALDALHLHADPTTRAALEEVHRSALGRALHRLAPRARAVAGWAGAALPLAITLVYLSLEVPVLDLLRLGGFAVFPIIALGILGTVAALRRAFLWGIVKDHRPETLGLDDGTPLHLAFATLLVGLAGTALGIYVSIVGAEEERIPRDLIVSGVKESLTCVILACGFASLTVVVHVLARTMLRRAGVPTAR